MKRSTAHLTKGTQERIVGREGRSFIVVSPKFELLNILVLLSLLSFLSLLLSSSWEDLAEEVHHSSRAHVAFASSCLPFSQVSEFLRISPKLVPTVPEGQPVTVLSGGSTLRAGPLPLTLEFLPID